jgi:hypothetical protein
MRVDITNDTHFLMVADIPQHPKGGRGELDSASQACRVEVIEVDHCRHQLWVTSSRS